MPASSGQLLRLHNCQQAFAEWNDDDHKLPFYLFYTENHTDCNSLVLKLGILMAYTTHYSNGPCACQRCDAMCHVMWAHIHNPRLALLEHIYTR
jgi:hypothetical protein